VFLFLIERMRLSLSPHPQNSVIAFNYQSLDFLTASSFPSSSLLAFVHVGKSIIKTSRMTRCRWLHAYSHSAVTATRNAGVYSFTGRCLPEGRAIIGFVANEGRIFWQALRELFWQRDVGLVPTRQGNDDSLRARIDDGMNLGVLGPPWCVPWLVKLVPRLDWTRLHEP
jgi:hypothetical protein